MNKNGFTLIELIITIMILGVMAALAIPRYSNILNESRVNKTQERLMVLKKAIVGDASVTTNTDYSNLGYEGDVGALPDALGDLITKPGSVSSYNKWTKKGWNGPYIKQTSTNDYLYDAWGRVVVYDKNARTITSYGANGLSGGGDDITLQF